MRPYGVRPARQPAGIHMAYALTHATARQRKARMVAGRQAAGVTAARVSVALHAVAAAVCVACAGAGVAALVALVRAL